MNIRRLLWQSFLAANDCQMADMWLPPHFMNYRITIRFSKRSYEELKRESSKLGLSCAELIRFRIENFHASKKEKKASTLEDKSQFLHQENNLLLRKIARHLNSQIVLEVDERLALNKEKSNEHT